MKKDLNKFVEEIRSIEGVSLHWNRETKEHEERTVHPTIYTGVDGIVLSAEEGDGFADYWLDMYLHPKLEEVADKYGMYWEWLDPGTLIAYEV